MLRIDIDGTKRGGNNLRKGLVVLVSFQVLHPHFIFLYNLCTSLRTSVF